MRLWFMSESVGEIENENENENENLDIHSFIQIRQRLND